MQLASKDRKRISLELGGKSPNIVFADADIDQAAASSPMSVFANTGQDCCARSRVFVERPVFDRFVEKFVESTRRIAVGDPTDEKTQVGPLVSRSQRETVISAKFEFGEIAREHGEKPHLGNAAAPSGLDVDLRIPRGRDPLREVSWYTHQGQESGE